MKVELVSKLPYAVSIKIGPKEEDCFMLSPYSRSGQIEEKDIVGELPRGVYKIPVA